MLHNNSHCYEFGPYRLDVDQRVLTRTGEAVSLTPKATDILTLLVANAGQLMAKDELLKQVWPDTFVEESNLTQNIFLLRRVLGDERPSPRYIETVVRRGYRFVGNVRAIRGAANSTEVGDPPHSSQPPAFGFGSHGATSSEAGPLIVAVLPFLNASGNPDIEYLADGLTDNIVNNLSRVSKLRVMSRSAVFRYKSKKDVDPRGVGRELGVGVVLVGKLTSHIYPLAITVELVDVITGWQLWGDTFDCQLKDLLEIQDRITRQLLNALKLNLTGDEEKRITARYTENAKAYQSYLEARYHWSKYTRAGIEKAISHFRQAIELDPNYALAYAGIVDCYLRLATNYLPPANDRTPTHERRIGRKETRQKRKKSNIQSDQIDPKVKLRFEWDWKTAERELRRANELRTGYPAAHQWYFAYRFAKRLIEQSRHVSTQDTDSNLPAQVLSRQLTPCEEVQILCAIAREQTAIGNFEAARLILKAWFPEKGWPNLHSLPPHSAADLLLTLGTLLAYLVGSESSANHKRAEVYLSGSISLFENLATRSRSAEAQIELARCYYRQGLFDLARETYLAALAACPENELELRSHCLIFWGMLERDSGRLSDSIARLKEAASLEVTGLLMRGRCDLEMATTLKDLALCDGQDEHNKQAMLHYSTALDEFEAVGHHRMSATVENNLGFLLLNLGFMEESEKHLLRARRFFESLSDRLRHAQVNETLTRLYVARGQYSMAEQTIQRAIQELELGDFEALLSEALTTNGIVESKLQRFADAQKSFHAAHKVAERCGDREGARRALVSMFEEMRERLDQDELRQLLDKLKKLHATTEPSQIAGRVEETIAQIESLLI
jgi:DNA-binding winged helix-turn-helix (wHTH) protein/TolB-like protein